MKFLVTRHEGAERVGVVDGDLAVLLPQETGDLVSIIEQGEAGLDAARRAIGQASATRLPLAGLTLLAPIRRFRRDILCTGWNYWDHFEEGIGLRGANERERPEAPTFFTKAPDVVVDPCAPIAFDRAISAKWDYEGEIALVFGRGGRSIAAADAAAHVFGYCLANDVSQRDLQQRHGGQWLKGKSIDGTMPLGPWIVTADEIDLPNLRLTTHVNGEIRQEARAAQMAFAVPELIAELSFGMTIHPGDVLLTGTPSGVGNAMKPPRYLDDGDEVVIAAEGLGELRNRVTSTDLAGAHG